MYVMILFEKHEKPPFNYRKTIKYSIFSWWTKFELNSHFQKRYYNSNFALSNDYESIRVKHQLKILFKANLQWFDLSHCCFDVKSALQALSVHGDITT